MVTRAAVKVSVLFYLECDGLTNDDPTDDEPAVDDADPFNVLTHFLAD